MTDIVDNHLLEPTPVDTEGGSSPNPKEGPVPFLDLWRSHAPLAPGFMADFEGVLRSSAFVNGLQVRQFEEEFAAYCGAEHCVGVASGLDALRLGLSALGLAPGDEVLVPALTFVATFEAVSQAGGVPVPVEISADDCCIDVEAASAAIGPRTRMIMPVDLYGRVADMNRLNAVAEQHGIVLLEDACQAHGAHRDGARAGVSGAAGAFSFYPGKNLGAMGDAGAFVTHSPDVAAKVRSLREHGQQKKYEHESIGWTARLDTIQAAVLLRKLPLLDKWNSERRAAADLYDEALAGIGDLILPDTSDRGQVWHLYAIQTSDPAGLASHLTERQIGTGRHYPEPPHRSHAYSHLGLTEGTFPVAERLARTTLSLPIFPGITPTEIERVAEGIRSWFARG